MMWFWLGLESVEFMDGCCGDFLIEVAMCAKFISTELEIVWLIRRCGTRVNTDCPKHLKTGEGPFIYYVIKEGVGVWLKARYKKNIMVENITEGGGGLRSPKSWLRTIWMVPYAFLKQDIPYFFRLRRAKSKIGNFLHYLALHYWNSEPVGRGSADCGT